MAADRQPTFLGDPSRRSAKFLYIGGRKQRGDASIVSHAIIDDHTVFFYSNSSRPGEGAHVVDTWDIIALADAHPEQPDRILDIYLNGTFDRQLRGTNSDPRYDRETSKPVISPNRAPVNFKTV